MKNVTKVFSAVIMAMASSLLEVDAQSYVTYNHDKSKMNQITVQETGAGDLTPAFYYEVLSKVSSRQEQTLLPFLGRCFCMATD